jgi:hypothetical protein
MISCVPRKPLRQTQRPDHVVGDHSAGVADDVRFTVVETEQREDVHTGIHARDDASCFAGATGRCSSQNDAAYSAFRAISSSAPGWKASSPLPTITGTPA